MSATLTLYGGFLQSLANKQINLNSDTFNVMLLTNSYTPSDSHRYQSDISTYEVVGAGYAAGGAALPAPSTSYTSNTLTFNGGNLSWSNSSIAARYAAIIDVTPGSASTNPVIGYIDLGQVVSDTNGLFQINWNVSGIFQITHS